MKVSPALLLTAFLVAVASGAEPEYGPAHGTLVIVGGGMKEVSGIQEKFIALAGGPEAHFVIVPTAKGNQTSAGKYATYGEEKELEPWTRRGLKHVRMLHTHDRKVAGTAEFVAPLREANAVWFDGGRQWNLVDSYAGTLTQQEFEKVLARGGVIGGSSAGATIQGDYLVRGDVAGSKIMMTEDPAHQHGFAFLRHSAIDQHINTRGRWDDLIPVMKKHPTFVGIGLCEDTAIIVRGDEFEVMGEAQVAIHDPTHPVAEGGKPYSILSAGDRYDLKARRVMR